MIFIHWYGPLSTSDMACIFVSTICVAYTIFAASEGVFGAIYRETAAVFFNPQFSRFQCWLDATGNRLSPIVSCIQLFYIYSLQLKTLMNIYLVLADYLLWRIYISPSHHHSCHHETIIRINFWFKRHNSPVDALINRARFWSSDRRDIHRDSSTSVFWWNFPGMFSCKNERNFLEKL